MKLRITEIPHVNLAPICVHHDGHRILLLLIQTPHLPNYLPVPLPGAVAHVNPRYIHPSHRQRLQLLRPTRGGAYRADQLRPLRATEPILLQLCLCHRIHVD
ncbi:Rap guanine nucleotide exchange factor 2 [Striga asiatica]|uniref:Rap guanine nucleotide exchange factor 2 n=1 Tax=Striga asiatica TaxID=4170 RepID=A0A5A7PB26_STRAF|nr:Rap guanine nucleotide exchange factor 2 [Striga asiatica]